MARSKLPEIDPAIPRVDALREYLYVSVPTAYKREQEKYPLWPEPIALPGRRIGYRLSAIRRWVDSLQRAEYGNMPTQALAARGCKPRKEAVARQKAEQNAKRARKQEAA